MLIAQRPTLAEEPLSDTRSRFVIEPLEPGFGYTLGNSLRRTLLSSIPGASVTSIRIADVLHEFSTVAGVKEDVTDLILNIKSLVVSSEHDEPVVMYLRKQGPGEVTAGEGGPKLVGISQRRTRRWTRIQCLAPRRWDAVGIAHLVGVPVEAIVDAAVGSPTLTADAVLAHLP